MGDHKTELAELIRRLDSLKKMTPSFEQLVEKGEREKYSFALHLDREQAKVLLPLIKEAIKADEKALERFEVSKELLKN